MNNNQIYFELNEPKSIEDLLQFKQLKPLSDEHKAEVLRISELSTVGFSEADVREEIINPILSVLGYRKGQISSVDREKHLKFLKTSKFIDYSLKLFEQNHWLVEAKKPKFGRKQFDDKDILQVLQYAVHPEVDAALIVLCDGDLFEVFDREFNLSEPIISFGKSELPERIDTLRLLLEPWQSWFFQKRRLLRKAEHILSSEVNITRAEELSAAFDKLVAKSRLKIWDNTRAHISSQKDTDIRKQRLENCSLFEAVEVAFFQPNKTNADYLALSQNIIGHFDQNPFSVVERIFPISARDANMEFWASSLHFMLQAEAAGKKYRFFPPWLASATEYAEDLETALKRLIHHCLTGFKDAQDQQIMLLFAAACRRLIKLLVKLVPQISDQAKIAHILARYQRDELDWTQVASSEVDQNFSLYNSAEISVPAKMLKSFSGDEFKRETAKKFLLETWQNELQLLECYPNYAQFRKEQSDREIHPTECMQVTYDYLGHLALCIIDQFPKWKEYVLKTHQHEISFHSALGLFKAKEFADELGITPMQKEVVRRTATKFFFLGSDAIHTKLIENYGIDGRAFSN